MTLLRISLRYLVRHRLQTVLLLVGIALGVAVVVAIDIANDSARRSFRLTANSLAGKATHQIVAGPGGIDDEVYRHLRVDLGLRKIAPVLEDYVTATSLDGRMMRLLGIDPFAEGPFRDYLGEGGASSEQGTSDLTPFLTRPRTVLLSAEVAKSFHLRPGDTLEVTRGSRRIPLVIVGLLGPHDPMAAKALSGLLVADVATAQEVFGRPHQIGHIDVIAGPNEAPSIAAALPPGLRLEPARSRTAAVEQLTESFELNLTAVSLLTIVVGVFLVYNTVTFFVVQRRPLFGILRALGVTRGQIFAAIVTETVILGVIGTLCGLALGVVLGRGALHLVTRTINDLYFVLTVTDARVSPWSLFKGSVVGIAAALISALLPAWEASTVAPAGVMRRSVLEGRVRRALPLVTALGLAMVALGVGLMRIPSRRVDLAFEAMTVVFLGTALLVPLATVGLMTVLSPLASAFGGAAGRMAPRSVVRSLSRTSVAIAALMVAVSIIVGIDVMVSSFRQTVVDWLGTTLQADVYVTTPSGTASRFDSFDPAMARRIAGMDGVDHVQTARTTRLESRYGLVFLLSVDGDLTRNRRFLWSVEHPREALRAGSVVVSEPFASRWQVGRGDTVTLPTDRGPHDFPIAGVYYDYGTERGSISMDATVYRAWWRDDQLSSVAVYLRPNVDAERFADAVRAGMGGTLDVISNRNLRIAALGIFDRTFAITNALRGLVTFVAFIGVLGTLMALQSERQREIGVLRATGMTVAQLARMILFETGLMGLAAGLLAVPVGAALAWALVYVINPRSFGWTIAFLPQPWQFVTAVGTALAAGLLAGVYPAWRFGRISPAAALRVE
jgi:putative ABC transport system permease protein